MDDNYHIDFLLTYRTFLPSPEPIVEKLLKAWNERVDLRKRVSWTDFVIYYAYIIICIYEYTFCHIFVITSADSFASGWHCTHCTYVIAYAYPLLRSFLQLCCSFFAFSHSPLPPPPPHPPPFPPSLCVYLLSVYPSPSPSLLLPLFFSLFSSPSLSLSLKLPLPPSLSLGDPHSAPLGWTALC